MAYFTDTNIVSLGFSDDTPISFAAGVIREGGLVAFPTETVYGLGADALNENAVKKIFAAKGRPSTDPLIVHIHDKKWIAELTVNVPQIAYDLMERFWPGPLTLILPKSELVPDIVTAGNPTVGLRMPNHPIALALLEKSDRPICAPSANLFSRPSPTTAQHVFDDLNGRVDVILDGGKTSIGVESTILSLATESPQMLRAGGISLDDLRALLPDLSYQPRYLSEEAAVPSPGTLLKHYSPKAALRLFSGDLAAVQKAILEEIRGRTDLEKIGILNTWGDASLFRGSGCYLIDLNNSQNNEVVAQGLFAALREFDTQGVETIYAYLPPEEARGLNLAIRDRLIRAAEGIIEDKT